MDNEATAVAIAALRTEMSNVNRRLSDIEDIVNSVNRLSISVEKLAANLSFTVTRLESYENTIGTIETRVSTLEQADGDKWKAVIKTIITALTSAAIGAAITKLF